LEHGTATARAKQASRVAFVAIDRHARRQALRSRREMRETDVNERNEATKELGPILSQRPSVGFNKLASNGPAT
jgi:hypothetical protein